MIEQYGSGDTGSQVAPASWPVETAPSYINPQENQESQLVTAINPLENETMIREWGSKLVDHLVDASKLAARVAALESKLSTVQSDYDRVYTELRQEVAAHNDTKRQAADAAAIAFAEVEHQKGKVERAENEALAQMQEVDWLKATLAESREEANNLHHACEGYIRNIASLRAELEEARIRHSTYETDWATEGAHLREAKQRLEAKIASMVKVLSE